MTAGFHRWWRAGPLLRRQVHAALAGAMAACGLWAATASPAVAQPVRTDHVTAELVAERQGVAPGQALAIGLRLQHIPHWHTYWRNPGDSGLPTTLRWTLPAGAQAGPINWPVPQRIPVGPLVNFGYEGDLLLPLRFTAPADAQPGQTLQLQAEATWLVCHEVCIPESATLQLRLPVVAAGGNAPATALAPRFAEAARLAPQPLQGWQVRGEHAGGELQLHFRQADTGSTPAAGQAGQAAAASTPAAAAGPAPGAVPLQGFPYAEQLTAGAQHTLYRVADGYLLRLALLPNVQVPAQLGGILVAPGTGPTPWGGPERAVEWTAPLAPVAALSLPADAQLVPELAATKTGALPGQAPAGTLGAPAATGLLLTLLLALLGGALLNLMPCVFPVLSIKLLGLYQQADSPAARRSHAAAYTAGVVLSFLALAAALLALRQAGNAVGWGFQLQSPAVVYGLALLFFVLGLNLFGAFEVGSLLPNRLAGWQSRRPLAEAFGSGVLAVLAASPCTAPFMGAALGVALTQPAPQALAVFAALGLGMALPYVALALMPGWRDRLPRPGAWMLRLKQALAFPMWATVVWLLWVLGQQTSIDLLARALTGLLAVALAAWWLGTLQTSAGTAQRSTGRLASTLLAVAVGAAGIAWAWPGAQDEAGAATAQAAAPAAATTPAQAPAAGALLAPPRGPLNPLLTPSEPTLPLQNSSSTATATGVDALAGALPSALPGALPGALPSAPPSAAAPAMAPGTWLPYSDAALSAALAAGRPVFVDFTAAWCVSCQVNKRLVLSRPEAQQAFAEAGVLLMRADWTRRDAEITAALARLGRNGVPVYLLQAPGRAPELLPELLTLGTVREALQRLKAGPSS